MSTDFIITERDAEILGVANSIDGMGVLAIWSTRGRDLVPHLTAQTTSARGFQVLLEVLRFTEDVVAEDAALADRVADVFILVEQVVARIVGEQTGDWPLPGARRVRGSIGQPVQISLEDRRWHLLGSQRGNGLWGLYRGAAYRAGLLDASLERLSDDAMAAAEERPMLTSRRAKGELRDLVRGALDGASPTLDTVTERPLLREVTAGWEQVPLRDLLWTSIVGATSLTAGLTSVLLENDAPDVEHRAALAATAERIPDHEAVIDDVVRCEDYLSVLESVFFRLCAAGTDRRRLSEVEATLPINLQDLAAAREAFADSGHYEGVARQRVRAFTERIVLDSVESLIASVLDVHAWIAKGRGRAVWVWEDGGRLLTDVDLDAPGEGQLIPGLAWRNDYFLTALRSVARELAEAQQ